MALRCQYFGYLPVGVAGGVYELPCRVGEVSGPFENTKKLLPAHSILGSIGERIFLIATSEINGHPKMQTLQTADHADCGVSRKLRPRKLRPQTLKTQTLWVSRKLRP